LPRRRAVVDALDERGARRVRAAGPLLIAAVVIEEKLTGGLVVARVEREPTTSGVRSSVLGAPVPASSGVGRARGIRGVAAGVARGIRRRRRARDESKRRGKWSGTHPRRLAPGRLAVQ
jgi:hypothetical protein